MHGTCARLDPSFSSTASSLVTVTGIEVAEIVTSFWLPRLLILVCVLFLLIAIKIHHLTFILLFLPLLVSNLGRIDFGGRGGRVPGIPPILMLLLLFVLFSLIRRFGILGGSRYGGPRSLGVILAMHCFLGLDLVGDSMSRLIPLETIQVSLSFIKTQP